MIRVREASFVASVQDVGRYPDGRHPAVGRSPELAFAGRSNVGKSSLINLLTGRRGLARVGGTPGRTRQLNFFVVETTADTVVFVDLPGYGYARVSKRERESWGRLVESYLAERRTLRGVVLVVDARRGIETEESELLEFLRRRELPAVVGVTKTDKLALQRRRAALAAVAKAARDVPVVALSAKTLEGREDLWRLLSAPPFDLS